MNNIKGKCECCTRGKSMAEIREIFLCYFYRYEPPGPLEEIDADIKRLETEIMEMLKEVTE